MLRSLIPLWRFGQSNNNCKLMVQRGLHLSPHYKNGSVFRQLYSVQGPEWSYEKDSRLRAKLKDKFVESEKGRKRGIDSIDIDSLTEDEQGKLQQTIEEIEIALSTGELIVEPSIVQVKDYMRLIHMQTYQKRQKFYTYLNKKYGKDTKKFNESEQAKLLDQMDLVKTSGSRIEKEFTKDPYKEVPMLRHGQLKTIKDLRRLHAKQYGIEIVFDFSYDSDMGDIEILSLVNQINMIMGCNNACNDPFQIIFANAKVDEQFGSHALINQDIANWDVDWCEESVTSILPKERLVYLSPNSSTTLMEFNPQDIYVIGALVDKNIATSSSIKMAESYGVRSARLPLREFSRMYGRHSLNLDTTFEIMLELKNHRNWPKALEKVPKRFLRPHEENRREKSTKNSWRY